MFEVLKSSSLLDLICLLFSRGTKKLPNGTAAGIKEMGLMGVCCLIGMRNYTHSSGFLLEFNLVSATLLCHRYYSFSIEFTEQTNVIN